MKKKFVIFSQSRSGSTLLHQLLQSHPEITCDGEILCTTDGYLESEFWYKVHAKLPHPYIYYRKALSKKNVYGFTLFIYHVPRMKTTVQSLYRLGWKIIYLERLNLVNQSLSNIIAMRSNHWHRWEDKEVEEAKFHIPVDKFLHVVENRINWHMHENNIVRPIPHLPVYYESGLKNSENWQATADQIFDFLGVDSVPVQSELKKTYPKPYLEMVTNYNELMEALKTNELEYVMNWSSAANEL